MKCEQTWYDNGQVDYEAYWLNGESHNPNGHACRSWHENGQIKFESYYLDDKKLSKEEFEARNVPSCSGRQVVIDGVTYILTPIKE